MIPTPPAFRHHSLPDWALAAFCLIDPTQSVSPPTSLSFQNGTSCTAVLQTTPPTNVPYGYLEASVYNVVNTPLWYPRTELAFRLRSDIFPPISRDYYTLLIYHNLCQPPGESPLQLIRYNAFPTVLASFPWGPPINQWTRFRITFVPLCTVPHPKPLVIYVHYYLPPDWVLLFFAVDFTDSWATRSENTIGFNLIDDQHWVDDAMLYHFQP